MFLKLLQLLACPKCKTELSCVAEQTSNDEVESGSLICGECNSSYRIERGIPRFVQDENYASSFGFQWNRFRSEQIDAINGTQLSFERFYSETGWTKEWMNRKWILDAGCGAGRFVEIASREDCDVVGVDLSNATDAAKTTLKGRRNVHLVQASIYELPFKDGVFDGCYCIGVIQHTPDPEKSVRSLPGLLKRGGRIAITAYERRKWTLWNAKYLIRPITARMDKRTLFLTVKGLMPVLFPVTEVTFRIPYLRKLFMHAIPVANYVDTHELKLGQRYSWAVMDTFDMLSPAYDQPQTQDDMTMALMAEGIRDVKRLNNPGLNLVGVKS